MINNKYKIKELLGKGRSAVYLCEDLDFPGKDIAIKILPSNSSPLETKTFKDEFFTLHKLNHPNIIKSFDAGSIVVAGNDDENILTGSAFFTLEYCRGHRLLEIDGVREEKYLLEILKQLCSALYYLHLSNYIYYDLKPENILVVDINGKPLIKLIDLGFAQNTVDNNETVVRGTAEYIAPEILKGSQHDHRVDFYSLGIILYRLIYDRFPFAAKNDIDIYKAHIEEEFEFPGTNFSRQLINTAAKLLKKNPSERYFNALQIISDLDIRIDEDLYKDWMPAKVFAGRKDILTILKTYLADNTSSEVFTVRGSEGSGKTAIAYELYSEIENIILFDNNNSLTGFNFVRELLKKIIYNDFIYPKLSGELLKQIDKLNEEIPLNLADELKSVINKVSNQCSFILILDSFNLYDDYILELFRNIIPILQVNRIKLILTENSDKHLSSEFISNLRQVSLTPFTEDQISEYLEKSFSLLFPKDDLKKLILQHADLLPGNLESFFRDIVLFKVINFTPESIEISTHENSIGLLKSSHEEIYNIRLNYLSENELRTAEFLSAFDISIDAHILGKFLKLTQEKLFYLLERLADKNIIHYVLSNANPVFVSEGLKRHTYSKIEDKKNFHNQIVDFLAENVTDFNSPEFARQLELAERFEESYKVLKEELIRAERIAAYSYQNNILQHLLTFPLNEEEKLEINIEFCKALTKQNDYNRSLELIDKLIRLNINDGELNELLYLKANCLTGIGELNEGKNILESLIQQTPENIKKNQLLLDTANICFSLNRYDEASGICNQIINEEKISTELNGLSLQLLGVISIYKANDLETALKYFEAASFIFEKEDLRFRKAQVLMNIGNIYSMKGDEVTALIYWNQSLELNQSIGNIQQEARLFINFGIFFFNNLDLEKSTENYVKAFSIFNSLGIKDGLGLVALNLGEVYSLMCEYQNALESLTESIDLFKQLRNKEEKLHAMYLLGKMFFSVGDFERLSSITKDIGQEINLKEIGDIHRTNYAFLSVLSDFSTGDLNEIRDALLNIRNKLSPEEQKYDYFLCTIFIVKALLKLQMTEAAVNELNAESLLILCNQNYLFEAERNYMLGIISESNPVEGLKPPFDYYQTTYDLIYNSHITELTWKVLYALSRVYANRGNKTKAKDYINDAKALLYFIAEKIKDSRLRRIYLRDFERKEAIKELNDLEAQL